VLEPAIVIVLYGTYSELETLAAFRHDRDAQCSSGNVGFAQLSPHRLRTRTAEGNKQGTFQICFSGTLQPTWIHQEAVIETAHGAEAFNSSECCAFHPDIQLRKDWKALRMECSRCKIEWEER
jgi:hypothetical protein